MTEYKKRSAVSVVGDFGDNHYTEVMAGNR